MLARRALPPHYVQWNKTWKAPFGPGWKHRIPPKLRRTRFVARHLGPFAFQANNTTRVVEYPWAFFVCPVDRSARILEVGGGLSGFQFVLVKCAATVINVDPLVEYGTTGGYPERAPRDHAWMNRVFRCAVQLKQSALPDAGLASDSFDVAYSISTLEHLTTTEIAATVDEVRRVLKPGGHFILTVDLFLNVSPFAPRDRNQWGTNVSMKTVIDESQMALVYGSPDELCGYDEFDPAHVLARLDEYFIGAYPALVQTIVLRKPAGAPGR